MNEFRNVCVAFNEAYEMFERTEKIYNFLKNEATEKMTPTEIALALDYTFTWDKYDTKEVLLGRVVKPLYWLLKMGLVDREPYTKKYTFDTYCYGGGHWVTDEKVINGITYTAKIWKEEKSYEKEFIMYRWFAK